MSQAYSVTINLPEELQETLVQITESYISLLKNKKYIQVYEYCESGKIHCHIGYLSLPQLSTSNETRKFKECYHFEKKEHPNAIKHCKHDNWNTLVGYIAKHTELVDVVTNLDCNYIEDMKKKYKESKVTQKVKNDILTTNQIADKFVEYIEKTEKENYTKLSRNSENYHESLVERFYCTLRGQIKYNTLCRMKTEKLIQYGRINAKCTFFI